MCFFRAKWVVIFVNGERGFYYNLDFSYRCSLTHVSVSLEILYVKYKYYCGWNLQVLI